MLKSSLQRRPLQTGALILCSSLGALVLLGLAGMVLVPLVFTAGLVVVWIALTLLVAWGGIEAMAALERWLERDPRFQR